MPEKSGKLKFCCIIHLEILSSALIFDVSEEVNKANLFFFSCALIIFCDIWKNFMRPQSLSCFLKFSFSVSNFSDPPVTHETFFF